MLPISNYVSIPDAEIDLQGIRAQGAGGQPAFYKEELLKLRDRRISKDGVIVIKAQQYRTQEKNREDALKRLQLLVRGAAITQKKRKPTKPSRNSRKKRMESKVKRGRLKVMRGKVDH
jgi:ribosome-associated protein